MAIMDWCSDIGRIKGVDQYVLVDHRGNVMIHDMAEAEFENVAEVVWSCGRNLSVLGRKNFKYAAFLRKNKNDFLIFPVGKYYLGVVERKGCVTAEVADAIMDFLDTRLGKRG